MGGEVDVADVPRGEGVNMGAGDGETVECFERLEPEVLVTIASR